MFFRIKVFLAIFAHDVWIGDFLLVGHTFKVADEKHVPFLGPESAVPYLLIFFFCAVTPSVDWGAPLASSHASPFGGVVITWPVVIG